MELVPRELFVTPFERSAAYEDRALPIESGQTISQPYTVAFMCQEARITPSDRVLEIGAGSGYGAAVLSHLASEVHTVERIPELAAQAAERLRRFGYHNVTVHLGDGTLGLPSAGPFDAILVTAGARDLPPDYVPQLAEGGRIVIPLGDQPGSQTMYRMTLTDGQLEVDDLGRFAFVPLIGQEGWDE
jgi:protein-L-isoaspartate(D-aspartate) O-methyltransferase